MTTKSLVAKMAEIAGECGYVQKNSRNASQNWTYASAEDLFKKVNPCLAARDIAVSSRVELLQYGQRPTNSGKLTQYAAIKISLTITDDSGKELHAEGLGEGSDSGDKAIYKANTGALKYAWANALTIAWGDDPEADESTDKDAKAPTAPKGRKAASKSASATSSPQAASPVSAGSPDNALSVELATAQASELPGIKTRILALRGTPEYDALRDAFKAREAELKQTA